MNEKEKYENGSGIRNSLQNSASEHHFRRDNLLSSRFGESLPSMDENNQQIIQIGSNLSRFPDDFTNLNDENLDTNSSLTTSTETTEQTNTNETKETEPKKDLSRWDNAWKEHEKQQQQQQEEMNEIPPKDENIDIPLSRPSNTLSTGITHVYVREFLPTSDHDPIFSILRDLFVRSFDHFYKEIEIQLNLKSDKTLLQWLDETFDEEQESILSKKYRCFLLCGNEYQNTNESILGFLTLKEEEEGSIYIAQVAIRLDFKRRGYGAQLLQHLRNIYPPNTQYWGLCRRANRPALQFYLKNGAKFMKNDDVATKYGYDPTLYAGFEFIDTVPVIDLPPKSVGRLKPHTDNSDQQPATIIHAAQNNLLSPPSTTDGQQIQEPLKKKGKKVVGCCIIS